MDESKRTRWYDNHDGTGDLALEQAIQTMTVDQIAEFNHTVDQLQHRVDALEEALDVHRRRERDRLIDMLAVHLDRPVDELAALNLYGLRDLADEVAIDVMASEPDTERAGGESTENTEQQKGFQ